MSVWRWHRGGRRGLAAVLALLVAAIATATTVAAAEPPNHPRLFTVASGPAVEGPAAKAEPLKDACGLAIDESDRLFVANYYQHAVYIFVPTTGGYKFAASVPVPEAQVPPGGKQFNGPCDLAIDSTGNLYVNNWHANVVKFAPNLPGSLTFGPPVLVDSNHSTGVAVDPADDHVFVDDRSAEEGSFVSEYEADPGAGAVPQRRIGLDAIGDGYGVAVSAFNAGTGFLSTAGWVYVADASDNTVKVFDPSFSLTEPRQTIDGAGTERGGFKDLTDADLAVDPRDGHLYVVDNLQPGFESPEAVVYEFSSLSHYRGPLPTDFDTGHGSKIIDGEPSSVALSSSGDLFVTSGNYFNDGTNHTDSQVQAFGPAAEIATRIVTATKSGAGGGTVFSNPAGLRCGTACEGEFPSERPVGLVAEPAPHSRFAGWSGCPTTPTAEGRCVVPALVQAEVDAEFEPEPTRTLSVAVGGAGQGSVASAPGGIDCGAVCSGEFDEGSEVTLNATAFDGNRFVGWSGCDSEPAAGACTVTMASARSVSAEFEPVPVPPVPPLPPPSARTLSVAATGLGGATGSVTSSPGGIDCGATCAGLYADGTTVTLEAHPAAASAFVGWGGCDLTDGTRCTVRLGADKVVVAAFGPAAPAPPRVRSVAVRGETATLRVAVLAAGELSAGSPRVQPTSALPIQAGVVSLRVKLNPRGVRALAQSKRHRLTVKVTLRFTPFAGGGESRAVKAVTFGAAGSGGGGR